MTIVSDHYGWALESGHPPLRATQKRQSKRWQEVGGPNVSSNSHNFFQEKKLKRTEIVPCWDRSWPDPEPEEPKLTSIKERIKSPVKSRPPLAISNRAVWILPAYFLRDQQSCYSCHSSFPSQISLITPPFLYFWIKLAQGSGRRRQKQQFDGCHHHVLFVGEWQTA